jgi:uncharacterized protein (TIGR03083 family)
MNDVYLARLDTLEQTWQVWAELGKHLTNEQWSTATRCPGWDVAALYAHCSVWPLAMNTSPPVVGGPVGELLTAADITKRFNAPGGLTHSMAATVLDGAVADAAAHSRSELLDRFIVHGPRALQMLRQVEATVVVPWPVSGDLITLVEALRIVVLETTVHLLDVQRALGQPPVVPAQALQDTVQLLAQLVPAVEFIEAATGRSTHSPLPVLR